MSEWVNINNKRFNMRNVRSYKKTWRSMNEKKEYLVEFHSRNGVIEFVFEGSEEAVDSVISALDTMVEPIFIV